MKCSVNFPFRKSVFRFETAEVGVADAAGLTLSNTSRHLLCLRDCGLVEARHDWRHVYYRLTEGVKGLLEANEAFIAQVADRVAGCRRPEMEV